MEAIKPFPNAYATITSRISTSVERYLRRYHGIRFSDISALLRRHTSILLSLYCLLVLCIIGDGGGDCLKALVLLLGGLYLDDVVLRMSGREIAEREQEKAEREYMLAWTLARRKAAVVERSWHGRRSRRAAMHEKDSEIERLDLRVQGLQQILSGQVTDNIDLLTRIETLVRESGTERLLKHEAVLRVEELGCRCSSVEEQLSLLRDVWIGCGYADQEVEDDENDDEEDDVEKDEEDDDDDVDDQATLVNTDSESEELDFHEAKESDRSHYGE